MAPHSTWRRVQIFEKGTAMPERRFGRTEFHPPPLYGNFSVYGLSALAREIWAVGASGGSALIAHASAGDEWQTISYVSDNPFTYLTAVHAVAPDDVWAVGSDPNPAAKSSGPHLTHFDGNTWQPVQSVTGLFAGAGGLAGSSMLNGVAAAASDDVWAVGSSALFPVLADVLGVSSFAAWNPLILHFDGELWVPQFFGLGWLSDVCAIGPGEFWAVGSVFNASHNDPLIVHGIHGSTALVEPPPSVPATLHGVAANSRDDVWAVGQSQGPSGSSVALALHYDGQVWTPVPTPATAGGVFLNDVACAARDDVWAVGAALHDGAYSPLILHYDGQAWSTVEAPPIATQTATLLAVAALPGGDAWVGGFASPQPTASGYSVPLVMSYHSE